MSNTLVFTTIPILFFLWLFLGRNKNICSVCAAISSTWILLFIARFFGWFNNDTLLALLLGGSVVGLYYFILKNKKLEFFRLPILLTLFTISYLVFSLEYQLFIPVASVWILFFLISLGKNKKLRERIILCCKNW